MIGISVRTNIKEIEKNLTRFVRTQIPFATAHALTALAKTVAVEEVDNLERVLDRPTPFTKRSVGFKAARKDMPIASVYVKDIAALYLEPYEFGGLNKLNSKALLKPVGIEKNQYGNLNRRQIAQLKARPDVFIGTVKGKNGEPINGVWQRPVKTATSSKSRISKKANVSGHLKLLIRFTDAHPTKQHLGWHKLAERVVMRDFNAEFGKALAYALRSAR